MAENNSREFEGRSVHEVIKLALKEMKLKRNQVKIEVLCEEEKGLFGMEGAKLAKIKISPLAPKEKS